MPFFILGVIILIFGIAQFAKAKRQNYRDGEFGATGLMMAGIILIVLYGIFYRALAIVAQ